MDKNQRKQELQELIRKYREGTATPEEEEFVEQYYNTFENEEAPSASLSESEKNAIAGHILQKIDTEIAMTDHRIVPMRRQPRLVSSLTLRRLAVAASILLIIGIAAVVRVSTNHTESKPPIAKTTDIKAPDKTKATITLTNGRTITLDSLTSLTQGDVRLTKNSEGKIKYDGSSLTTHDSPLTFNTLTNPRGSKVIDMTLIDGSHVWLNAGSSITYPIAFAGSERRVTMTGEAYFEIAHDKTKPFYVSKGDAEVRVLGTHFNVNAYDDDDAIRVTLLEGSVQVFASSAKNSAPFAVKIKPGQQAVLTDNGQLTTNNPDLEQTMAWKNDLFKLGGTSVKDIMRQVSRWYDADIEYKGDFNGLQFTGVVSRKENVSQLLRIMEATGDVHFKIEGRKIVVMK